MNSYENTYDWAKGISEFSTEHHSVSRRPSAPRSAPQQCLPSASPSPCSMKQGLQQRERRGGKKGVGGRGALGKRKARVPGSAGAFAGTAAPMRSATRLPESRSGAPRRAGPAAAPRPPGARGAPARRAGPKVGAAPRRRRAQTCAQSDLETEASAPGDLAPTARPPASVRKPRKLRRPGSPLLPPDPDPQRG